MAYYKTIPDAEEHIKDLETKPYEVRFLFTVWSFGAVLFLLLLGEIHGSPLLTCSQLLLSFLLSSLVR